MLIEVEGSVFYGRLVQTARGVLVMLCDATKPKGQRKQITELVDAPIGVVAEKLRHILEDDHTGGEI